nr:hypothetical protein [Accumulibacter sp.]
MARYGQAMKDRVVARLLPPESLAIASGASACLPTRPIHRLATTVVLACLENVEDARKMLGDCSAEALERFQSAAAGPVEPALHQWLRLIRRVGRDVDGPQGHFSTQLYACRSLHLTFERLARLQTLPKSHQASNGLVERLAMHFPRPA